MAESNTQSDRRSLDLEQRIARLEEQLKTDPDHTASKLAEAYILGGRPKEAIKVLEKHKNGQQPDVERGILLAQALFDIADTKQSAAVLEKAVKGANITNNLRAQMLLGEIAVEQDRTDEAKKYLKQVRSLDPTHRRAAELLKSLGENIDVPQSDADNNPLGFGTTEEGRETAGHAFLQIGIGLVVCATALGIYYKWSGDNFQANTLSREAIELASSADVNNLRAAEANYLEALEFQSSNEYALSGLAEIYTLLWVDHGFADMKAKSLQYVADAKSRDIQKAERYGAEILALYGEGQYEQAEQLAASVIERGAQSEKVFYALGLAQLALGKQKLGRDNIRRAHEFKGTAPHYAVALGDAYDEDNDDRNAVFYWNRAKEHNSNYVRGVARSIMGRAGRGEDPNRLLEEIATIDTRSNELGNNETAALELARSTVLLRVGQSGKSLAAAQKAIDLVGPMPRLLVGRGRALLAEGKTAEGLKDFETANKDGKGAIRFLFDLVDAYMSAAKPDLAINALTAEAGALAQVPSYHVTLADAYRLGGKWDEAIAGYDKALKLHEEYLDAMLGRGLTFFAQKKFDEATTEFEKAVSAQPNDPRIYVAVGIMWVDQGASSQAVTQLDHAEKLFKSQGADRQTMGKFYADVLAALGRNSGNSANIKDWAAREKAYRESIRQQAELTLDSPNDGTGQTD